MPLHYPLYTPYLGVPPFLYYPPLVCGSPGLAGREDGGQGGGRGDARRSDSITALRTKAREHEAAMEMQFLYK